MRKISKIIIHCSATPRGKDFSAEVIRDWHVKGNGWSDIGYHYFLTKDGKVHMGRNVNIISTTQEGCDEESVSICLSGEHNFTEEQFKALRYLCWEINSKFK